MLSSVAYGQTRRGPVEVQYTFNHDGLLTDRYELCNTATTPMQCDEIEAVAEVPNTYKFSKSYSTGPFTVAVRACNAAGCSTLTNTVNTPIIVNSAPNAPTNLSIVIVVNQGE
jgi:hypothetical protein